MAGNSIDVQQALAALLQGTGQNPFTPAQPGPTFTNPDPLGLDTLKALFQNAPAPGPIDIGATIPMGTTSTVPTFRPLPPITEEIGNILTMLQGFGVGVPPPAPKPPGLLGKIALGLQGFGAGVQGQGPQFLAALRAERERPAREAQAQRNALLADIIPGVISRRGQQEQARELATYGAERQFGLEQLQQEGLAARAEAKRQDAQLTLIGNRAAKLGEMGVPAQLTQPIAEALSGLRVWTPELLSAYDASVPAKARADLARQEAETAKTRAEAQLLPLRAKQLKAEIGSIGLLNRQRLEELDPTSNKKVKEVFDYSIREALAPTLASGSEPDANTILKATNAGRRVAVERLGGDLREYDRFLQRVDADPAFAAIVREQRQRGLNDLQLLRLAKESGKF